MTKRGLHNRNRSNRNSDFEVGYGRPPKSGQFKQGHSGNPSGRPRGRKSIGTMFEELLRESVVVREGGSRKRMSKVEAMLRGVFVKAIQGDAKAWKTLIDLAKEHGHFDYNPGTQNIEVTFVKSDGARSKL